MAFTPADDPWSARVRDALSRYDEPLLRQVAGKLFKAKIGQPARDGKFEPAVIEVPAGKKLRLDIRNEGKSAIEFESRDLRQEKVIPPGGKASVTINALKAGEYKFFDEFHEKTGQGKLVAK